ncbi:fused MFS/spermidine synthase [Pelagibius litoralis]|uniref:Fused MFS/spermidine synthase n=2 Tax=Pelagibius litoralis TaxID=374515 RepID=A0A967C4J7_9PROT|nr:fused MFS/spermidine synthase [Pelagibius litoralis]
MMAPYLGMSLYTWTAIIAVVLAGFSAGHWFGGWVAERNTARAYLWLAATMTLGAASTTASLWLVRLLSGPVLSLPMDRVAQISALTFAVFFLPSFCAGVPSPVLSKVAIDQAPHRAGRTLGLMFALSALGAIAGTLLAGFLFISWIGTSGTILAIAAVYLTLAVLFFSLGAKALRAIAASLALLLAAISGIAGLARIASPCDVESDYYCIRVVDMTEDLGVEARLLVLDHLGHGINLRDQPSGLVSPYVEIIDLLARAYLGENSDASAYFIGGGAYTLPRAWASSGWTGEITVAEIDPAVTAAAASSLWVDTSAFRIVHDDARAALSRQPAESLDVIVGDAFKDIAVPAHLMTREFAQLVERRLSSDGIYLMNLVDRGDRLTALFSMVTTLQQVFPVVEVWVDREQAAVSGRITFVILAAQRPSSSDRLWSLSDPDRQYLRWPAHDLDAKVAAAEVPILSDDFTPVDRLLNLQ